ncbi:MAG TPA: hypothetical protein VIK62_08200 [Verrucomicrobiae bacterium]
MIDDSNSEICALKRQVFTLLVALVVVSGTLTVYLYRQASITGKDLNASSQLIANVNQNEGIIVTFANQLAVYAQTHPDIRPILTKYGVPSTGIPTAAAQKK